MRKKKNLIVALGLSITMMFGNCLAAYASTKDADQEFTMEYSEFADVQESVRTETGDIVYLTTVEKVEGVYQAVYLTSDAVLSSTVDSVSPQSFIEIEKELVKFYQTFDEIEEMITYTEYNDNLQTWMKGYLYLQKTEKSGSFWYATYKGTMWGHI